jgi:integrating conjugative element protein (TIGR03746 family)
MSQYANLLAAKQQTIKALSAACAIPTILAVLLGVGWLTAPSRITLHYPPDLTGGAVHGITDIPKANIYSFTYYIFQQMNRWPTNGEDDYFERIHTLRNYLTPACFEDRLEDYRIKKEVKRVLAHRERAVWEIPGRGFDQNRVRQTSHASWIVSLDMHVTESYRGEHIKDRLINYPLKVVRYAVDPELNPWGLAIDCLAGLPRIIEVMETES